MRVHQNCRIALTLALIALLLAACGTLDVAIEPTAGSAGAPSPAANTLEPDAATPTQEEILAPTTTQAASETPTSQPTEASLWREVRDPGTGFGFALPCWWVTYLPTAGAENYAISVASYDESYFMANSVKGQWLGGERPQGAYKLDFYVNKQIDASLTDEESVRQALTSEEDKVDLVQVRAVGRHTALLAIQSNVNNPSSTGTVYAFRLSPTSLMMVSAAQASDLTTPVVQAILSSLALTPDEAVELPAIDPGPALIAKPDACQP